MIEYLLRFGLVHQPKHSPKTQFVLRSRHGDWNLTIEAAALIAVAMGVFGD
jgi:hypothetical protein